MPQQQYQRQRRHCLGVILFYIIIAATTTTTTISASAATTTAEVECPAGGEAQCRSTENESKQQSQQDDDDDSSSSVWKIPKDVLGQASHSAQLSQQGVGTRIVSNLISSTGFLQYLTNHQLWFDCFRETRGSNTYWLDRTQPPQTWYEQLAVGMWNDQPIIDNANLDNFAGFEIWCNILNSQGPLDWHIDKDQIAYKKSQGKNVSLPLYGSVFYGYPHNFTGGVLELMKYDSNTIPDDLVEPPIDEIERIQAEYNRLVIFNASKFHRVSPIKSGVRVTLAVNIWKDRPMVADVQQKKNNKNNNNKSGRR